MNLQFHGAAGDPHDLLRWHSGLRGTRRTYLVHAGDVGPTGLRDALRDRGVPTDAARPGQRIDLAVHA